MKRYLTKDKTIELVVYDYDIRIMRRPGGVLFSINTYPHDPEQYLERVCLFSDLNFVYPNK